MPPQRPTRRQPRQATFRPNAPRRDSSCRGAARRRRRGSWRTDQNDDEQRQERHQHARRARGVAPMRNLGGVDSLAMVARSRADCSWATTSSCFAFAVSFAGAARGAFARLSHHSPKPSMIAAATMPRPGAAKGVVPKKGMGIAFCRAGVPGNADMVKVMVPSAIAAGTRRRGCRRP